MAKYLEIRNSNNNVVIDDESMVIQLTSATPTFTIPSGEFVAQSVDSTESMYRPSGSHIAFHSYNWSEMRSPNVDGIQARSAYRVLGTQQKSNPYGTFAFDVDRNDASKGIATFTGGAATEVKVQGILLNIAEHKRPMDNAGLVIFDSDNNVLFDAARGFVYHLASRSAKIAVGSAGSFSVKVMSLAGMGIDPDKLFLASRIQPRASMWQTNSSNSNLYRVGYHCYIPRLRVESDILYVDYMKWSPKDYYGSYSAIYTPMYAFSIYYVPDILG